MLRTAKRGVDKKGVKLATGRVRLMVQVVFMTNKPGKLLKIDRNESERSS